MTLWERFKRGAGYVVFWVCSVIPHRVVVLRSRDIPSTGAALIVPNHITHSEPTSIARFVIEHRRFPHFLIRADLFRKPVLGWLGRWMQQIPVQRGTSNARDSLESAARCLEAGEVVVIYPEGTITKESDFRPGPAKTGAARLALEHPEVPVIPVGHWGSRPGLRQLLRRPRVTIRAGAPVDLSPWHGRTDQAAVEGATEAIMAAITRQVELVRGEPFA